MVEPPPGLTPPPGLEMPARVNIPAPQMIVEEAPETFRVLLRGLPDAVMREEMFHAMIEQANIDGGVASLTLHSSSRHISSRRMCWQGSIFHIHSIINRALVFQHSLQW